MNSTKSFSEILTAARKLIRKPENWCKYEFALDKNGRSVKTTDINAVQFCILGAIRRAAEPDLLTDDYIVWDFPVTDFLNSTFNQDPTISTAAGFNNAPTTTHADILNFLDHAIRRAKRFEKKAQSK